MALSATVALTSCATLPTLSYPWVKRIHISRNLSFTLNCHGNLLLSVKGFADSQSLRLKPCAPLRSGLPGCDLVSVMIFHL